MGERNFLVEGVSGTGKTSVCHELRRRGHHAVNGDTELAFQGDPATGEPTAGGPSHWHHLWRVADGEPSPRTPPIDSRSLLRWLAERPPVPSGCSTVSSS